MKLWFRTTGVPYNGNEPAFYNSQDFDWAKHVIENYPLIKAELASLIAADEKKILKPYFEKGLQSDADIWKTEGFYFWSRANRPMAAMFPKTHAVIKEIPGLVSASINLLEPQSKINEHYGDTNAIYRCHLGLQIPYSLPLCGFRVKSELKPWEEGNMLIFLDAYTHEAFNFSNNKRYILQLDVLRPEFRNRKHYVCSKVLGATFLYGALHKIPGLRNRFEKWNTYTKEFLVSFFQLYAIVYLWLQRKIFSIELK